MSRILTTNEKALEINLDPSVYGSFAEIGAGQEVAANFFKSGAASGTIAKTISAYDMTFSDYIYGKTKRYVCEPRLLQMLDKEYWLIEKRLHQKKSKTKFFVFASTLEILNFKKTNEGHGWMGFRFQTHPQLPPNDCIIHIILKDSEPVLQKQAIGIIGVNLIYACVYGHQIPFTILNSIRDNLGKDRVEIDTIQVTGQIFEKVDNRLLALHLVKNRLTHATIFDPKGRVQQPFEALYKKNVMIVRGRFRPLTLVNMDIFESGLKKFKQDAGIKGSNILEIAELTLNDLSMEGEINEKDFLDRAKILCSLGKTVMISNYHEYYKLMPFISNCAKNMKVGVVLGILNLEQIFDEQFYEGLDGGVFEALGKLFGRHIKMFVYPSFKNDGQGLYTCDHFKPKGKLSHLFKYLMDSDKITDLRSLDTNNLEIVSDEVLSLIQKGDERWKEMVPKAVAKAITADNLFGYRKT